MTMAGHTPPLLGPLGGPTLSPAWSLGSSGPVGQAPPVFRALSLAPVVPGMAASRGPRPLPTCLSSGASSPSSVSRAPGQQGGSSRQGQSFGRTAGLRTDSSTTDGTAPRSVGRSCVGTEPPRTPCTTAPSRGASGCFMGQSQGRGLEGPAVHSGHHGPKSDSASCRNLPVLAAQLTCPPPPKTFVRLPEPPLLGPPLGPT